MVVTVVVDVVAVIIISGCAKHTGSMVDRI